MSLNKESSSSNPSSSVWDYKHGQELPSILEALLERDDISSQFHVFSMLLHSIMLDCGYMIDNEISIETNHILICYTHSGCSGLKMKMYCSPMGPFVSINAYFYSVDADSPIKNFNMQLKYNDAMLVDGFNKKPRENRNLFKDLKRFTSKFAENFAYQAANEMRKYLGLPPLSGLLSVLPHLLQKIFLYLDVKDITNASGTCIRLNNVLKDNYFWKKVYARDFKDDTGTNKSVNWQEKYKFHYNRQKEPESRLREEPTTIPNRPVPMPGMIDPMQIIPNNPSFPGIIGGEYDLRPSFPYGGPFGGSNPMGPPGRPGMRPRFDPFGPPGQGRFRPGRGGGMMDFDDPFQSRDRPGRGGRFPGGGFDDDMFM